VFQHTFPSRLLGLCLLSVEKMSSVSCDVCSMKMGLLRPVSSVLFDKKKTVSF